MTVPPADERTMRPNLHRQPTFKQKALFWIIIVPIFAWIGRDGIRSQTQLNPNQFKLAPPLTSNLVAANALLSQSSDGSYLIPLPVLPPGTNQTVTVTIWAINVFKNTNLQQGGRDYNIDPLNPSRFIPTAGWLTSDTVQVQYWAVAKSGPGLASASLNLAKKSWIRRVFR
jgi:hypothetical protein